MNRAITLTAVLALMTLLSYAAPAAVVDQALYRGGEEPGDTNGRLDSSGNARHLNASGGPTEATDSPAPAGSGSTVYANVPGNAGYFGTDTSIFMPANNWGVALWVRSDSIQNNNFLVVNGGSAQNGDLKIGQINGVWASSYHNIGWIGATGGTGQTATVGEWTNIAVIDEAGTSTLYINGIAQAGTAATPTAPDDPWGTALHLGVNPGGTSGWSGDIDETRIFTFGAGEFTRTELGMSLINGSFEVDANQSPTAQAWTLANNVKVASNQTASDGVNALAFNGANSTPNGIAEQTFNTIAGQEYRLEFDFGKFATGSGTAQLDIDVFDAIFGDGVLLLDQQVSDGSGANTNVYETFAFLFKATGTTTTLRFTDTSILTNSYDTMLDNIIITEVPAPAALPAGLALVGLLAARRRRR